MWINGLSVQRGRQLCFFSTARATVGGVICNFKHWHENYVAVLYVGTSVHLTGEPLSAKRLSPLFTTLLCYLKFESS